MVAHWTPLHSTRQRTRAESAERNATTASSASLNKTFEGNVLTRMSSKLYQGSTSPPMAACLSASWTQRPCSHRAINTSLMRACDQLSWSMCKTAQTHLTPGMAARLSERQKLHHYAKLCVPNDLRARGNVRQCVALRHKTSSHAKRATMVSPSFDQRQVEPRACVS